MSQLPSVSGRGHQTAGTKAAPSSPPPHTSVDSSGVSTRPRNNPSSSPPPPSGSTTATATTTQLHAGNLPAFLLPLGQRPQSTPKDIDESSDRLFLANSSSKAQAKYVRELLGSNTQPQALQNGSSPSHVGLPPRPASMDVDSHQRLDTRIHTAEERPRPKWGTLASTAAVADVSDGSAQSVLKGSVRARESISASGVEKPGRSVTLSVKDIEEENRGTTAPGRLFTAISTTTKSDLQESKPKLPKKVQQDSIGISVQDQLLLRSILPPVSKDEMQELQSPFLGSDGKWHFSMLPARGPYSRKEAILVQKWLEKELEKLKYSPGDPFDSILQTNELLSSSNVHSFSQIFEACYHELIRQVSVACQERGDLLELIWDFQSKIIKKVSADNDKLRGKINELEDVIIDLKTDGHIFGENIDKLNLQISDMRRERETMEESKKMAASRIFRLAYDLKQSDTTIGLLRKQISDFETMRAEREEAMKKMGDFSAVEVALSKKALECGNLEKKIEDLMARNSSKQYKMEKELVRLRGISEKLKNELKKKSNHSSVEDTSSEAKIIHPLKDKMKERGAMSLQDISTLSQLYPNPFNPTNRKNSTASGLGSDSNWSDSDEDLVIDRMQTGMTDAEIQEQINSGFYRTVEVQTVQRVKIIPETKENTTQTQELRKFTESETQVWPIGPTKYKPRERNTKSMKQFRRYLSCEDFRKHDRKTEMLLEVEQLPSFTCFEDFANMLRLPRENPNMRIDRLSRVSNKYAIDASKAQNDDYIREAYANVDVNPDLNMKCDKAVQAKPVAFLESMCQTTPLPTLVIMEPTSSTADLQAVDKEGEVKSVEGLNPRELQNYEKIIVHQPPPPPLLLLDNPKTGGTNEILLLESGEIGSLGVDNTGSALRLGRLTPRLTLTDEDHAANHGNQEEADDTEAPKSARRKGSSASKAAPSPRKGSKSPSMGTKSHPGLTPSKSSKALLSPRSKSPEIRPSSAHKSNRGSERKTSSETKTKRNSKEDVSDDPTSISVAVNTDPVTITGPEDSTFTQGNTARRVQRRQPSSSSRLNPNAITNDTITESNDGTNQKPGQTTRSTSKSKLRPLRRQKSKSKSSSRKTSKSDIAGSADLEDDSEDDGVSDYYYDDDYNDENDGHDTYPDAGFDEATENVTGVNETHGTAGGKMASFPKIISVGSTTPEQFAGQIDKKNSISGAFLICEQEKKTDFVLCLNEPEQLDALKDAFNSRIRMMAILLISGREQSRALMKALRTPRPSAEEKIVQYSPRFEAPPVKSDKPALSSASRWKSFNMKAMGSNAQLRQSPNMSDDQMDYLNPTELDGMKRSLSRQEMAKLQARGLLGGVTSDGDWGSLALRTGFKTGLGALNLLTSSKEDIESQTGEPFQAIVIKIANKQLEGEIVE